MHDRHRNLVVAATGTGKTVIAALDYARMPGRPVPAVRRAPQGDPRAVPAHLPRGARGRRVRRAVRRRRARPSGGGTSSPACRACPRTASTRSPQTSSTSSSSTSSTTPRRATYRRLLDHLTPVELLGLTATPERTDGVDVRSFFDGRRRCRAAALGRARERSALPVPLLRHQRRDRPVAAGVAPRRVRRRRPRERLHRRRRPGPDRAARAARQGGRPSAHARARLLRLGGARRVHGRALHRGRHRRARAVSGGRRRDDRAAALRVLRERRGQRAVRRRPLQRGARPAGRRHLLLLRPTQSATVFLQQLGRGLRRTPDKPVLTVLDFIGQQRREFRFDLKYRALTGASRTRAAAAVEQGFAVPARPGCELVLDAVAREVVLENVKRQLRWQGRSCVARGAQPRRPPAGRMAAEARARAHGRVQVGSWTAMRREAGLPTPPAGPWRRSCSSGQPPSPTWTTLSASTRTHACYRAGGV